MHRSPVVMEGREAPVILDNHLLKPYTSFKIGGLASFFAPVETCQRLEGVLDFAEAKRLPLFVLAGGSNVLISDAGLMAVVIHPLMRGISLVREDSREVWLRAGAGELWDGLVAYATKHEWWGIENLSHIPGQVGAALVQNIGAYGQQISDVMESAGIADLSSGETTSLSREECKFGYRQSIFNTTHKGRYVILSVTLRLSKQPNSNLSYPDVRNWFERSGNLRPSIQEIRDAITRVRDRKFPFPREEVGGNAGSFFKNIVLTREAYETLERRFQNNFSAAELSRLRELRSRFSSGNAIKVPTAFLVEVCGFRGYRAGGVQVNEAQPLVLVNRGGATAREVMLLARTVRQTIFARTGIAISIEPELVGFSRSELDEYLRLAEAV
ncbi:MAG TPA: UDP-N-acetylmuramate dehydrogenase [Terriglobia bacterium]|nr:UDP-N-acetylmuramate dehydrogenase [Terriglobia bacterium]